MNINKMLYIIVKLEKNYISQTYVYIFILTNFGV